MPNSENRDPGRVSSGAWIDTGRKDANGKPVYRWDEPDPTRPRVHDPRKMIDQRTATQ